jgi:SNF2 family DNA or RNA helicase
MNVLLYQGTKRSRDVLRHYEWTDLPRSVVLTTYEILARDGDHLGVLEWKVLVVDEAHRCAGRAVCRRFIPT